MSSTESAIKVYYETRPIYADIGLQKRASDVCERQIPDVISVQTVIDELEEVRADLRAHKMAMSSMVED